MIHSKYRARGGKKAVRAATISENLRDVGSNEWDQDPGMKRETIRDVG